MTVQILDLSDSYLWNEGLPLVPRDFAQQWVNQHVEPENHDEAWTVISRQWLETFSRAMKQGYCVAESAHTLFLVPPSTTPLLSLLPFAENCQRELLRGLRGVTDFSAPGKQVVLVLRNKEDYYRHLSAFCSEGHHGDSSGMHIRSGYSHIVLCGTNVDDLQNTLAHELTHASLSHLSMPQWLEEGFAQLFESHMTGRALWVVDVEMAQAHRRYWFENGLDCFWHGDGFSQPGDVQDLCYQLAEILVRLLVEEYRPGWFGWHRKRHERLLTFLREANHEDCGVAAAETHLGLRLEDLAGRFLGPEDDVGRVEGCS